MLLALPVLWLLVQLDGEAGGRWLWTVKAAYLAGPINFGMFQRGPSAWSSRRGLTHMAMGLKKQESFAYK